MFKKLDLLSVSTYLYLYIPIVLFLIFWIKPYLSIPTLVLLGVVLYKSFDLKRKNNGLEVSFIFFLSMLLLFILILIWCIYSGQGGFNTQYYDWQKHNVILNDLIKIKWPVRYNMAGKQGVLSYYIGFYLVPALVGKATSFNIAQDAMLFWSALGIFILVLNIYQSCGNKKVRNLYLILFGLIFFGTFIYILSSIYRTWNPGNFNNGLGINVGDWFSNDLLIQYSTNITQLCYVFPQMIPAGIVTILFIRNSDNMRVWGSICVPLILYSTFTFVGVIILMLLMGTFKFIFQRKDFKNNFKQLISLSNIFSLMIGILLMLYILCNIIQPKPAEAGMTFELINYQKDPGGFIIFQLSWILWILVLFKYEKHNPIMWSASIILFVLPFFKFGGANDFCMRVSIPALFVLNYLVIKNLIIRLKENSFYSQIIILLLLLTGLGPMGQLKGNPWKNIACDYHKYNMPYSYGPDFYKTSDVVKYQYVDWNANKGIAQKIIKNK